MMPIPSTIMLKKWRKPLLEIVDVGATNAQSYDDAKPENSYEVPETRHDGSPQTDAKIADEKSGMLNLTKKFANLGSTIAFIMGVSIDAKNRTMKETK